MAAEYNDVINFGIGEPHFDTPRPIIDYTYKSMLNGETHYTSHAGNLRLRKKISDKLRERNNLDVAPDQVVVTVGAMEALILTFLTIIDPGDEVIIQDPSWVNYNSQVLLTGGKPVWVPVKEENKFSLQAEDVARKISDKTKIIIINTPNNPTGAVIDKSELLKIGELALENNILIISDETYENLIYDTEHFSLASIDKYSSNVISIYSFSKEYSMTGWRIGYAVGDKEIIGEMSKIHGNVGMCTSAVSQSAAFKALDLKDEAREMVEFYRRNRDLLVEGLNSIPGISCITPRGAFYVFPNIKELGFSSRELAYKLLHKVQVVTVAGSAFGDAGEGYLRFSYVCSQDDIKEGVARIKEYI